MTSRSAGAPSTSENLRAAICMLAWITKRPHDLDELLPGNDRSGVESNDNLPTGARPPTTEVGATVSAIDSDFEDSAEDLEVIEDDEGMDEQSYLAVLQDRVLDRLAETLARFKSDPKERRLFPVDSKHVSSTMMIVYPQLTRVMLLCAKNEGLDQGGTSEDTEFLDSWRKCMECISKRGPAAEEAKASLFTLVLYYQQPRITYYLKKLQNAFTDSKVSKTPPHSNKANLSENWLRELDSIKYHSWVDDNGNKFKIPVGSSTRVDAESETAMTGGSWENINDEVGDIFDKVEKLSQFNLVDDAAAPFTDSQASLLKELMTITLSHWKSVRHRSAIKAKLQNRFRDAKQGHKRQKVVITALKFLCRVYLSVVTFIDAAEKTSMFQSIECVPIQVPPQQSQRDPSRETPMEVLKSLRIEVTGNGWADHLQQQRTKVDFYRFREQKRHMHAELQLLYNYDAFYSPRDEGSYVHPYIGCSKRCCLLCYCFILAHGGFKLRGTHETIMGKWELPTIFPSAESRAEFQSASEHLFRIIIAILQNLFRKSFPPTSLELLAQSSAALSTARTVSDQELGQMEKSELNLRQMMMMPMVTDDGVLITQTPGKPGFAYVMGGALGKGREMSLPEAELYKDNHIRSKLGLERREEMPAKQISALRVCRRCERPSRLRCSACRMSYCSTSCQRKNWKQHVFVCAVRNRPNDFDRLGIILSKLGMLRDEAARSQLLVDLFSDDHLCRAFGFVNCFDDEEVANLLCIYSHLKHIFQCKFNRIEIGRGNLGSFIEAWARFQHASDGDASSDYQCIPWYLARRALGFDVPNWEGQYVYQILGMRNAECTFSLRPADEDPTPLSPAESTVLSLYTHLFRRFNNVPDVYSSEWINFGFCFCRDKDQRDSLANMYIELAKSGTSLGEIAQAWETSSLSHLMQGKGIDLAFTEANGIGFHRPDVDEFGIYRLIAEVTHTVSGRFCDCFRPKGACHPKHETHLSRESEGDYGFHGTNAWERWQLLNFYNYVFRRPGFDARRMQRAKRHPGGEALEGYLDSLVSDFRRKMGNRYLADAMFPKIRGRLVFPDGRGHCYCVVHDVWTSEGLDWRIPGFFDTFVEENRA
ncbi:hypothetical protein CC80DRAFT_485288 [Byssothecium circinans]|uniref:MYND-type domain-containing protein n=1 Tax=Byssothecium circinans TaxID=147558 RepID=A0A6A5TJ28_9PLEO|nr:hypothetical protein CC80DRAFT_485288 [Byssothecium circinans]